MPVPLVSVRNWDLNPMSPHAAAGPRLGDDDALKVLGHVDDQILHRLAAHAVDLLRDDVGPRHLELVSLAPHHLDENGQLQLAAADHLHLLG